MSTPEPGSLLAALLLGLSALSAVALGSSGLSRLTGHARLVWSQGIASLALLGLGSALARTPAPASAGTLATVIGTGLAVTSAVRLLVARRTLRLADVLDAAVVGVALAVCVVVDTPLAMLGMSSQEAMASNAFPVGVMQPATGSAELLGLARAVVGVAAVLVLTLTAMTADRRLSTTRWLLAAAGCGLTADALSQLHASFGAVAFDALSAVVTAAAFVCVGLAARAEDAGTLVVPDLSRSGRVHDVVRAWSFTRTTVVVGAFVVPLYCLSTHGTLTPELAALLSAVATMVLALAYRAAAAISGLAQATHELEHRATHDALTGLPNRAALTAHLAAVLRTPVSTAVYFVDLNGFKLINDSFGHAAGDALLCHLAVRLREGLPKSVLVARIGGDELVVVESPAAQTVEDTAERIRALVAAPVVVEGRELTVGSAIGIASFGPGSSATAQEALRQADTAMYEAKASPAVGIRRYESRLHEEATITLAMGQSVASVLARGSVNMDFEPIVAVDDGRLLAAEGLLRPYDPRLGPISPGDFVRHAEQQGQGSQVLSVALEQALGWLARERATSGDAAPPVVTVNVSAGLLHSPVVVEHVAAALARWGLDPSQLWLEITESRPVEDLPSSLRTMHALVELGVRWVLDDFGTGYSSAAMLADLPLSAVKVDRRFLAPDPRAYEVIRRSTELAHSFGVLVVAEGCETREQLNLLRALGVDAAQGWLFAALSSRTAGPLVSRVGPPASR
jgi:diguanylate cyclase (GGDEF)-like protein